MTAAYLRDGLINADHQTVKDLMRHIDEVKRFRRIIFDACLFFIVGIGVAFDFIGFGIIEKTIWIAGHAWAICGLDKSLSTSDRAIINKMLRRRLRSGISMTVNHRDQIMMIVDDQCRVLRDIRESIENTKNDIRHNNPLNPNPAKS